MAHIQHQSYLEMEILLSQAGLKQFEQLNLLTRSSARTSLTTSANNRELITAQLGTIGAAQSRLNIALRNLMTSTENIIAATSRITNADIADNTAKLVQERI
jgi:flagellin-like hook-associated protein FlgL